MAATAGYSMADDALYGASSADRRQRVLEILYRILEAFGIEPRKAVAKAEATQDEDFCRINFTFSTIALCAKLSRIDGPVTKEEFLAFREVFPMQDSVSGKIRKLFVMACQDGVDYLEHARRIAGLYPQGSKVLRQLLERLFLIAHADRNITKQEAEFLRRVASVLGFSRSDFHDMMQRHTARTPMNPYAVLGIASNISNDSLKRRYRSLMQDFHPDRLTAQGSSVEVMTLANRKVAKINEAYHKILRVRGLR